MSSRARVLHVLKHFRPTFTGEGIFTERLSPAMERLAPDVEHEVLAVSGVESPFTRVVNDPFVPVRSEGFRACRIEIDRSIGRVTWTVDGHIVHEAISLEGLPDSVHIGYGFFTLVPVGSGQGSCHGQGGHASWRSFNYAVGEA